MVNYGNILTAGFVTKDYGIMFDFDSPTLVKSVFIAADQTFESSSLLFVSFDPTTLAWTETTCAVGVI